MPPTVIANIVCVGGACMCDAQTVLHDLIICPIAGICLPAAVDLTASNGPSTAGNFVVRGAPITVWDSHRQVERKVFPILVFAFADTPARRTWALTTGHSGNSGCDKCFIRGVRELPDGTPLGWSAFCGYYRECPAVYLEPDPVVSLYACYVRQCM